MRKNDTGGKRQSYGTQTLGKALTVLDCFSLREPELTAAELGRRLDLSTSTLYRYLTAMVEQGHLEHDPVTGRYAIGLRVVELAGIALSRVDVRRHGQTELDALAAALDMHANMSVLFRGDVLHLAFSVRTEVDRMRVAIGRRTPAHCTAMGKAMLAHLPRAGVHELVDQYGWRPLTENSIRSHDRLDAELDAVLRQGYAIDRGEVRLGQICVAAPVRDRGGRVVAAISVSAPKERVEAEMERVIREVCHHAERLSMRLGYSGRGEYDQ